METTYAWIMLSITLFTLLGESHPEFRTVLSHGDSFGFLFFCHEIEVFKTRDLSEVVCSCISLHSAPGIPSWFPIQILTRD